ncbi:MAG: hypothetical protein P9F75_14865 [Candidatus Contendobacter sp.]|nr:hypothetical protein [Candidatus Contendobacter sp.]
MLGYTVATEFRPPDDPAAQPAPAATPMDDARQAQRKLLEQRVAAKWDALIRKDFAAAYSFTSPAYRKLYSAEAFKRNFGDKVAWQRITVVDVNFQNDDAATVGINLFVVYHDAQSGKPLDMKTYVQEPWVRTEGQWWYLMKQ